MAEASKAGRAEGRSLDGVTAVVTRSREQSTGLAGALESLGARVVLSPAIRFEEPEDWSPFDSAARRAADWDWLIVTSVNGVAFVSRRLERLGLSWRIFEGRSIAAIGPATAQALAARGLEASLVPEEFRAEGLLDAFASGKVEGKSFLLARAERARDVLPEELRKRGARVRVVTVYRTVPCAPATEAVDLLAARGADAAGETSPLVILFTSPSTVSSFVGGLPAPARAGLRRATLAAIGPVTGAALREQGLVPALQPDSYTIPDLVRSIAGYFASR